MLSYGEWLDLYSYSWNNVMKHLQGLLFGEETKDPFQTKVILLE